MQKQTENLIELLSFIVSGIQNYQKQFDNLNIEISNRLKLIEQNECICKEYEKLLNFNNYNHLENEQIDKLIELVWNSKNKQELTEALLNLEKNMINPYILFNDNLKNIMTKHYIN